MASTSELQLATPPRPIAVVGTQPDRRHRRGMRVGESSAPTPRIGATMLSLGRQHSSERAPPQPVTMAGVGELRLGHRRGCMRAPAWSSAGELRPDH